MIRVVTVMMLSLMLAVSGRSEMQDPTNTEQQPILGDAPINFEKLVASLRSSNEKPDFTRGARPSLPEKYDFSEQRRIRKVISTLQIYPEESWPFLVRNINNDSYSIIIGYGDGPRTYTVGNVCDQIIRNSLFSYHDQCGDYIRGTKVRMINLKDPDLLFAKKLRDWLLERKEMSLKDLQIELLGTLKTRVARLDLPDDRKTAFLERIEERVQFMKESKEAYLPPCPRFIPNRETWWYLSREGSE